MTRNRRRKLDTRAAAAASGTRYTQARRLPLTTPGASIRTYKGEIGVCSVCGQPAYDSSSGASHFAEQEGAVFCPAFPAAASVLRMDWDDFSLHQVQERYPRTFDSLRARPDGVGAQRSVVGSQPGAGRATASRRPPRGPARSRGTEAEGRRR